jgi:hypothetical protein
VVFTTVSAGFSSISDEFCSPARYSGFAMNATKITIAIPAKRVRTSPESTYYTGYRAIKNLHDTHSPGSIPNIFRVYQTH